MCCKPSLLPCPWTQPSPQAGPGREAAAPWQGLRSETGAGTAPAAHTHTHTHTAHSSHYVCHSSDPGSELSALSRVFLAENISTATQGHLQEHCSFPLHLQFPPEVKQTSDSNTPCTGWSSIHYLFLAGDLILSVFWQWEQNREQIIQSLALEPKAESEWHNRDLEKPR